VILIYCSFVAVPGIGTKPPDEWINETGKPWLAKIDAPGIGVFSYDHAISKSNEHIWQDLLDRGESLLMSLMKLVQEKRVQRLINFALFLNDTYM
jgi:hypothetical protein